MVEVRREILIKSDIEKIWNFINDVSLSLGFSKFHRKIELKKSYKIGDSQEIIIIHNFGFGKVPMKLKIVNCEPYKCLIFRESGDLNSKKVFNHESCFLIIKNKEYYKLIYKVNGSFNNKLMDKTFTPLLKAVMIDELKKIKLAVESSDDNWMTLEAKQYNPV